MTTLREVLEETKAALEAAIVVFKNNGLAFGYKQQAALKRLTEFAAGDGWMKIESAPVGENDFFLVGCSDQNDKRSPFVIRGSILKDARKSNVPQHLSLSYLTHWRHLPSPPQGDAP